MSNFLVKWKYPILKSSTIVNLDKTSHPKILLKRYFSKNTGPLNDIRVLDLSRVLAGPYCTMILGDLGAEILKIEHPVGGDDTRSWGPPFVESANGENKESCYFLCLNRNKKSICINLKSLKGNLNLINIYCFDVVRFQVQLGVPGGAGVARRDNKL